MKKKCLVLFSVMSIFISGCVDDESHWFRKDREVVEKTELTVAEARLKNQLQEAALIVVDIVKDQNVLSDLVSKIDEQPKWMEDRIKFKDLMTENTEKSSNSESLFGAKFKEKLNELGMKSASTLVEELIDEGVEVYIPYPIKDYPEGTDIVVTSDPIDNKYENVGYFVNSGQEVMANDELTEDYPVIIVRQKMFEEEVQKTLELSWKANEERYNNYISMNKSTSGDPTVNWYDESKHYAIHIPAVYVVNDHVTGLFWKIGIFHITTGTVKFNLDSKIVMDELEDGGFSSAIPRKLERYCEKKWAIGWHQCNFLIWQDWHPAISENSIAFWMDTPNETTDTKLGFSSKYSFKIPLDSAGKATLGMENAYTASVSLKVTTRDHLYGTYTWLRERYINDYTIYEGEVWGEDGERWIHFSGVNGGQDMPATQVTNELFFTTYCDTW